MKIGLVLEGGGMRGLYTAGVLDTMMAENWKPHYVVEFPQAPVTRPLLSADSVGEPIGRIWIIWGTAGILA